MGYIKILAQAMSPVTCETLGQSVSLSLFSHLCFVYCSLSIRHARSPFFIKRLTEVSVVVTPILKMKKWRHRECNKPKQFDSTVLAFHHLLGSFDTLALNLD